MASGPARPANETRRADETELAIAVSHFPPGTSKWNKIERRLFAFIGKNWRGQPRRVNDNVIS